MYTLHLTNLTEGAVVVRELIKCLCNSEKGCGVRYKCIKANKYVHSYLIVIVIVKETKFAYRGMPWQVYVV